jgi:hypothetical protein
MGMNKREIDRGMEKGGNERKREKGKSEPQP